MKTEPKPATATGVEIPIPILHQPKPATSCKCDMTPHEPNCPANPHKPATGEQAGMKVVDVPSYQGKPLGNSPTGEWTVFGTSVQVNGESLFHCSTSKDAEIASLEHTAALAAEREFRDACEVGYEAEVKQLRAQLAARAQSQRGRNE